MDISFKENDDSDLLCTLQWSQRELNMLGELRKGSVSFSLTDETEPNVSGMSLQLWTLLFHAIESATAK